jgi:hypothetical protein
MIVPSRLAGSIPVIPTLVFAALTIGAPANTVHAKDCLASPNSPAPNGSWWYYRLEWATQRKCWYLRPIGTAAEHTAERVTTDQPKPSRSDPSASLRPSDSTDDSARSLPAADTAPVGSIVQEVPATQASTGKETSVPTAPPTQNDAPVVSPTNQQNAHEGPAAVTERPVQETSASSQTNALAAASGAADVAPPDAAPRIIAHTSTDDAVASVPDDYIERVVRSRKQAANEQAPIPFFVIAIILAAIGISIHFVGRRRFSSLK